MTDSTNYKNQERKRVRKNPETVADDNYKKLTSVPSTFSETKIVNKVNNYMSTHDMDLTATTVNIDGLKESIIKLKKQGSLQGEGKICMPEYFKQYRDDMKKHV